jgi:hypothetical protein
MKRQWLAFLLNFRAAGPGFFYMAKWKWADVNPCGAIAVGISVDYYAPGQISIPLHICL